MQNVERSWLEKILNDPASTLEEKSEARAQLEDSAADSQRDQDRLILRYLNHELESGYFGLPDATIEILHGLTYWPLGLVSDQVPLYVDALVSLHGRTLDSAIKARCLAAIGGWLKLAQRYHEIPGADKAARHAAQFLNSLHEKDNHNEQ